ncbi:hypothetical protein HYS94_05220 [Candidatus Daviesbacteria bacterium]|nr:hypothetical protein [Candidatus Daviesbacteria bacterium]
MAKAEVPTTNRFATEFLYQARGELGQLNDLEAEIETERLEWQSSGATDHFVDGYCGVIEDSKFAERPFYPQERELFRNQFRHSLYADTVNPDTSENFAKQMLNGVPPTLRPPLLEVFKKLSEHRSEYRKAVRHLTSQRQDVTNTAIGVWRTFMGGDYNSFWDFGDFLSMDDFKPLREEHQPFLQVLHGKGPNLLEETARDIVTLQSSDPPDQLFQRFIMNLQENRQSRNSTEVLLQWLQVLSYPSGDLDPETIMQRIRGSGSFPADLKKLFTDFLRRPLATEVTRVHNLLTDYRAVPPPSVELRFKQTTKKKGGQGVRETTLTPDPKFKGELQVMERVPYQLALDGRGVLGEEEKQAYIERTVHQIANHDQRMKEDITEILDSLIRDPFGFGIGKLTAMEITSEDGQRKLPLRRYRADQRISFQHEASPHLRVVFYLDRKVYPHTVIVREILNHEDFDKKYTS